jgi:hypothetical protein
MYNSAQINCSCREINSGNWTREIWVKVHGHQVPAIRVVREILGTGDEYLNFLKYIRVSHLHTVTSVREIWIEVHGHRVPKMNTQTS